MKKEQSLIHLAPGFSLNPIDYANQGNTILGIRGSGKTYAGTKIAEGLLDHSIPIVGFDPTGVWPYLRNGVNGHPGYPVVVAGGLAPDIELTVDNATRVLRAALEEGVSIIFDLKGYATANKGKWVKIISDCVEVLMEINLPYGLRHVFFEEAAEVVPQRPGIDVGAKIVYARIESMARMGRNYALGYTLVNQRAEEINKAIFEICEQVLVFRQAGKNSLKSIRDWLDHRGMEGDKIKAFLSSLPKMPNGECWVVNQDEELQVKIGAKNTFHPDPKKGLTALPKSASKSDTSKFIARMKAQIVAIPEAPAKALVVKRPSPLPANVQENLDSLKTLNASYSKHFSQTPTKLEDDVDKKEREGYQRRIKDLEEIKAKLWEEKENAVAVMKEQVKEIERLREANKLFEKRATEKNKALHGNGAAAIDYDFIIAEVLKKMPAGTGAAVYEVAPLEKLKKDFLKAAKDKLSALVSGLDDQQKTLLKWVEQAGKGTTKSVLYEACFGKTFTSGGNYNAINGKVKEMEKLELVRQDDKARVFPKLKELLQKTLGHYDATEAELDNLYSHILMALL